MRVKSVPTSVFPCLAETSARGPYLLAQAAIRLHLATEGNLSIINIASMAGSLGMPEAVVYVMSKHALIGMTKTIAVEYATRRVRCNSVSPVRPPQPFDHS